MHATNSIARIVALAAIVLAGCNSPTAPTEEGESGTQYSLTDVARESRSGVDLVSSFLKADGVSATDGLVTRRCWWPLVGWVR